MYIIYSSYSWGKFDKVFKRVAWFTIRLALPIHEMLNSATAAENHYENFQQCSIGPKYVVSKRNEFAKKKETPKLEFQGRK